MNEELLKCIVCGKLFVSKMRYEKLACGTRCARKIPGRDKPKPKPEKKKKTEKIKRDDHKNFVPKFEYDWDWGYQREVDSVLGF